MKLPKTATKRIIFVKTIRVILVVATIVIGLMLIGPVLRFKTSNLVERVISLPGLIRFTPSYGITYTFVPDISADGRYLVFSSDNNRLVPGDLNQTDDLFLYDVQTHHLGQISLTANGFPANGASEHPVISADGRYIAFHSQASNIADTTGSNIFVYERETGETVWISSSVETEGTSFGPAISADGRFIAFLSQFKGVFIYDREQDMLERIPQADEEERIYSEQAIMSGNGRYIAFEVSRLVADTGSNCYFVLYDQEERITQPLPLSTDKCALARYAVLSDDGRYFLFGGKLVG